MLDAKAIALKIIDEEGLKSLLLVDVADGVIKAKLDELVQSSENSLDDALVAMIYPLVRDAVEQFLDEKIAELQA